MGYLEALPRAQPNNGKVSGWGIGGGEVMGGGELPLQGISLQQLVLFASTTGRLP